MKNKHSNKLAMYIATLELMNQNNGTWGSVPAVVNQVTSLGQKIASIQQQAGIVSTNTTGLRQDKVAIRNNIAEHAFRISSALVTLARDTQNNGLRQMVNFSMSDFLHGAEDNMVTCASKTHELATQHIAALADYNITQQSLNDLQQYLADFDARRAGPKLAKSQKKTASLALDTLFRETDDLLKNGLDRSMRTFKLTQPSLYQTYTNARVVIDLGHASRYIELSIPPMSHISVHHVVIGSQMRNIGTVAVTIIGDDPSNEEGVQLIPADNMILHLSQPVITAQNFHNTIEGRIKVRVTSRVPVTVVTRAAQLSFNIPAAGSMRIANIVRGAVIENMGPASLTMCDCSQPDCNITDDDQPCGYEQTIESGMRGHANTTKNYINATNKDTAQAARVKVWVFQTNPIRQSPDPII